MRNALRVVGMIIGAALILAGVFWCFAVIFLTTFIFGGFMLPGGSNPNTDTLSEAWIGLLPVLLGILLFWYAIRTRKS